MNTIGRDSARAEAQQAFVGLLATPLLAARVQPRPCSPTSSGTVPSSATGWPGSDTASS